MFTGFFRSTFKHGKIQVQGGCMNSFLLAKLASPPDRHPVNTAPLHPADQGHQSVLFSNHTSETIL